MMTTTNAMPSPVDCRARCACSSVTELKNHAANPIPTIRIAIVTQRYKVGRFIGCRSDRSAFAHCNQATLPVRCRPRSIIRLYSRRVPHLRIQLIPRLLRNPLIRPRRGGGLEVGADAALAVLAIWFGGGS